MQIKKIQNKNISRIYKYLEKKHVHKIIDSLSVRITRLQTFAINFTKFKNKLTRIRL